MITAFLFCFVLFFFVFFVCVRYVFTSTVRKQLISYWSPRTVTFMKD